MYKCIHVDNYKLEQSFCELVVSHLHHLEVAMVVVIAAEAGLLHV